MIINHSSMDVSCSGEGWQNSLQPLYKVLYAVGGQYR